MQPGSTGPQRSGPKRSKPAPTNRNAPKPIGTSPQADSSGAAERSIGSGGPGRVIKRVLIGAAAVLVGWAIFFSGGESDGGKIELITGTNAVLAAINDMQITDAEKAPLIAQAEQQRLEMWQFTVFPSSSGSGETYAVFTDLGAHTYSITNSTQTFLLPATMGSQGFSFTANADNQNPGMYTKWFTPQGTFPYDMQAGDSYQVPVR